MRVLDISTNAELQHGEENCPSSGAAGIPGLLIPHTHTLFLTRNVHPWSAWSRPSSRPQPPGGLTAGSGSAPRAQGPGKRQHMIDSRLTNRSSGSGSGQPIVALTALKPAPSPALCRRAGMIFAVAILCVASPPFL